MTKEMGPSVKPLPPSIDAEVQRILDAAARRILEERLANPVKALVVTKWRSGKRVDQ